MEELYSLGVEDFRSVFGEMTERVAEMIQRTDLQFRRPSPEERDTLIHRVVKHLLDARFEKVGEHRRERWEHGWGENLRALQNNEENAITPGYFKNNVGARWKREFILPVNAGFDERGLSIILEWLFEKYMKDAPAIYEFGCGTGRNLLQLRKVNPSARLFGLDWAKSSQELIAELVRQERLTNAEGRNFDFFNPDRSFSLEPGAVIYTVGALEQIGDQHMDFINYLCHQKPALCVHIEPIAELLDKENLLDFLALEYFLSRGYLAGFLGSLRWRQASGQLTIRQSQRTFFGGNIYVDHYSVVVWSPL